MLHTLSALKITTDLIGHEIIKDTAKNIYNLITNINNNNVKYVNDIIDDLDIVKNIEIVDSLFQHNKSISLTSPQKIALNNLHDISVIIKKELHDINDDLKYLQTIYFSYLRQSPYKNKLINLQKHSTKLNKRLDLVIKLLN